MSELETLRPEVREALNRQDRQEKCDEYCPVCADRKTIRVELLRLASENFRLHEANAGLYARMEHLEKAEAELAALKARIADAPMGVTRVCPYVVCIDIEGDEPYLIAAGKNVRMVVEE